MLDDDVDPSWEFPLFLHGDSNANPEGTCQPLMLFHYRIREYYFYAQPVDMRKGIDALAGIVRSVGEKDPLSTDLFIFLNRRRNQVKMLHWQQDGFAVFYKRLEKGTFECLESGIISTEQLLFLLQGVVQKSIVKKPRYSHQFVIN